MIQQLAYRKQSDMRHEFSETACADNAQSPGVLLEGQHFAAKLGEFV